MPRDYSEHAEQAAYFQWVGVAQNQHPLLRLAYAVPNGAALARVKLPDGSWSSGHKQAAKLKREGMHPGVLDVHLPFQGRLILPGKEMRAIGLWLEFKRPGDEMSPLQAEYAGMLREAGHRVELVRYSVDAVDITEDYLGIPVGDRAQLYR